jgi:thiosulfate dehydrogenase
MYGPILGVGMKAKSGVLLSLGLAILGAVATASGQTGEVWPQNDPDKLPAGPAKETVLYGRKLFNETYSVIGPEVRDASMRYSGNNLSCQNCHLQGGTQKFAIPMVGVYGLFPQYIARENEVRTIEERVEGCMERSMNGRVLPLGGKEMKALVAYIQFLSTGIPVGKALEGRGSPNLPLLARAADPKHGQTVYMDKCAFCHQENGQGQRKGPPGEAAGYVYPPLWGADSFNDGAGMHRLIASASFIRANMPFGTHYDKPELSVEDAWDVAAYINSQPRPHRDHLDVDYPDRARKPVDAPFPPYPDKFSPEQHQYGPFQPLLDAQRTASQAPR